jgi:Secretion system C-terminal sorting domain
MKRLFPLLLCAISLTTTAQTVTGVVKNQSGAPIVNALVCQANNPSIFIKTNSSGQYSIAGNSTTALRIGALGFKTIKSTTLRNIALQPDPLLVTDVFHVSFDHLRAGSSYSQDELKADFNTASGAGFNDGSGAANDRASVDYKVSRDAGGVSLKVKFPKGQLKTSSSGIDTRIPLKNTYKNNDFESTDLYVSYWVRFSDDFEFNLCGGKMPSLGGSVPNTRDGEARWKGRIMWRKGGSIQFYMELPGDDSFSPDNDERFWGTKINNTGSSDICVFEYTPYLKEPKWHNIELHYRFETPSKPGIFEGWVDGVNHDFMNASVFNGYRPAGSVREKITINTLLLSTFLGGSANSYKPSKDLYAWFDEIRVSKTRINDSKNYPGSAARVVLSANDELSMSDAPSEKKSGIYPNPSTNIFNLEEDTVWQVLDPVGNPIINGEGKTIDLTGNARGIYFVKSNKNKVTKIILE